MRQLFLLVLIGISTFPVIGQNENKNVLKTANPELITFELSISEHSVLRVQNPSVLPLELEKNNLGNVTEKINNPTVFPSENKANKNNELIEPKKFR